MGLYDIALKAVQPFATILARDTRVSDFDCGILWCGPGSNRDNGNPSR